MFLMTMKEIQTDRPVITDWMMTEINALTTLLIPDVKLLTMMMKPIQMARSVTTAVMTTVMAFKILQTILDVHPQTTMTKTTAIKALLKSVPAKVVKMVFVLQELRRAPAGMTTSGVAGVTVRQI
jgi:hypothetical protein